MVDKTKFAEEDAAGYRMNIIGRNIYVTEAMKNHALEKLSKIERFHNHVIDLHMIMDIQKLEHSVEIILKFDHFTVKVATSSTDMYASIDRAVDKLQKKIRRWKDRIQDHHRKTLSAVDMKVNVLQRPYNDLEEINAEIEQTNREKLIEEYRPPHIIGVDKRPLKYLTTEEAIMKMELSDDAFLIFRGEEDQKLKVIYPRSDGNYGLIFLE